MPTIEQARQWYQDADAVHDFDHVLRVYRLALRLAEAEGADVEIVGAAALLHDAQGSGLDGGEAARAEHHQISAAFAEEVLLAEGWPPEKISAVQHCILTHRFRSPEIPETIEAQVVFDADKLDAIGAVGAARAIAYSALEGNSFYEEPSQQFLERFETLPDEEHTAYHEFLFKLSRIKDRLYTASAKKVAEERHAFMEAFFYRLRDEFAGEK